VLGEFALRGLNLTKIESRPSKRALGDYMFYIDCEGHLGEAEMQEALEGVKKKAPMLKILGTYPIARRK
ncbi:prephenate dehydratase, partial [ANME-1 cluster archaeon AG-394-G06]|nr:prephenate dehydratase [ANME-1 cluster archaeon AG-394-G06]